MSNSFESHVLDNRLTFLAEPNERSHTAAVGFYVRTGARDEDKSVEGVSHFLEHMMFKATSGGRSADDVNREFDEIGADYNAFTSHEQTVYYAHVLPELLPRAIDLLSDMLRPTLADDDFNMEKNVILEEIGMYDDRPIWRLHDALYEKHYGGHALGYRVLGTVDSIKALQVEQMRNYFSQRYSPDNIGVSVAGRFDVEAVKKQLSQCTATWKPTQPTRQYDAPDVEPSDFTITQDKVTRFYLALMSTGPSAQDDSRYTGQVLADVLGDSEGSRLYWALVDPGYADEADLSLSTLDRTGAFVGYVSCDPDRAEQVESILFDTLDGLTANPNQIDDAEIERAKNKLATAATLSGETPAGRMRDLGHRWSYGHDYATLAQQVERLMSVTTQQVRDMLRAGPFTPRTVARLGPAS